MSKVVPYGRFDLGKGQKALAHRWVYELMVEKIPEGMELDHKCLETRCVNPEHMEVVTGTVNKKRQAMARRRMRGTGVAAQVRRTAQ